MRIINFRPIKDLYLRGEEIEGADELWKLTIDVGELGKRIICAGIKEYYSIVKDINN